MMRNNEIALPPMKVINIFSKLIVFYRKQKCEHKKDNKVTRCKWKKHRTENQKSYGVVVEEQSKEISWVRERLEFPLEVGVCR